MICSSSVEIEIGSRCGLAAAAAAAAAVATAGVVRTEGGFVFVEK
jgi:hypothetical protein